MDSDDGRLQDVFLPRIDQTTADSVISDNLETMVVMDDIPDIGSELIFGSSSADNSMISMENNILSPGANNSFNQVQFPQHSPLLQQSFFMPQQQQHPPQSPVQQYQQQGMLMQQPRTYKPSTSPLQVNPPQPMQQCMQPNQPFLQQQQMQMHVQNSNIGLQQQLPIRSIQQQQPPQQLLQQSNACMIQQPSPQQSPITSQQQFLVLPQQQMLQQQNLMQQQKQLIQIQQQQKQQQLLQQQKQQQIRQQAQQLMQQQQQQQLIQQQKLLQQQQQQKQILQQQQQMFTQRQQIQQQQMMQQQQQQMMNHQQQQQQRLQQQQQMVIHPQQMPLQQQVPAQPPSQIFSQAQPKPIQHQPMSVMQQPMQQNQMVMQSQAQIPMHVPSQHLSSQQVLQSSHSLIQTTILAPQHQALSQSVNHSSNLSSRAVTTTQEHSPESLSCFPKQAVAITSIPVDQTVLAANRVATQPRVALTKLVQSITAPQVAALPTDLGSVNDEADKLIEDIAASIAKIESVVDNVDNVGNRALSIAKVMNIVENDSNVAIEENADATDRVVKAINMVDNVAKLQDVVDNVAKAGIVAVNAAQSVKVKQPLNEAINIEKNVAGMKGVLRPDDTLDHLADQIKSENGRKLHIKEEIVENLPDLENNTTDCTSSECKDLEMGIENEQGNEDSLSHASQANHGIFGPITMSASLCENGLKSKTENSLNAQIVTSNSDTAQISPELDTRMTNPIVKEEHSEADEEKVESLKAVTKDSHKTVKTIVSDSMSVDQQAVDQQAVAEKIRKLQSTQEIKEPRILPKSEPQSVSDPCEGSAKKEVGDDDSKTSVPEGVDKIISEQLASGTNGKDISQTSDDIVGNSTHTPKSVSVVKSVPGTSATAQPVLKSGVPATSTATPVLKTSVSATSAATPVLKNDDPATSSTTPLLKTRVSATSTATPVLKSGVPVTSTASPMLKSSVPATSTASVLKSSVPATSIASVLKSNVPATSTASVLKSNVPATSTASVLKSSVPATSSAVPVLRSSVSVTSTASPVVKGGVPATSNATPVLKSSVPGTSTASTTAIQQQSMQVIHLQLKQGQVLNQQGNAIVNLPKQLTIKDAVSGKTFAIQNGRLVAVTTAPANVPQVKARVIFTSVAPQTHVTQSLTSSIAAAKCLSSKASSSTVKSSPTVSNTKVTVKKTQPVMVSPKNVVKMVSSGAQTERSVLLPKSGIPRPTFLSSKSPVPVMPGSLVSVPILKKHENIKHSATLPPETIVIDEDDVPVKKKGRPGRPRGSKDKYIRKRKSNGSKSQPETPTSEVKQETRITPKRKPPIDLDIPVLTLGPNKKAKIASSNRYQRHIASVYKATNDGKPWVCSLCGNPSNTDFMGVLYGPYYKSEKDISDNEGDKKALDFEMWVHRDCAIWSHNVYLIGQTLHGLDQAVDTAKEHTCSVCSKKSANLQCFRHTCKKKFHYPCASRKGCFFKEDNFTVFCPDHKPE